MYVAESVTRQGRSYISASITLFESFLANNIKFNNLNEVITFIHNIVEEKNERVFDDRVILDRNITLGEAFYKVMNTADMMNWIPTEKEMMLVWEYMQGLSTEDLNRIYYKNNVYSFADLPIISEMIIDILCNLKEPFMNPNKPPKEIKDELDKLYELMYEYVYYGHFYIDKLDRIEYMQRDISIITDTDSTIISLDAWYRFVLEKTYNIDMDIKHQKFDIMDIVEADEFGDRPLRKLCKIVEPKLDYDFYTDEVIELERAVEMCKIPPQDNLKYSIVNIMAYICGKLVIDYLERYSKLTGSYAEGKPCELIMKNEFYFLRCLMNEKRSYANVQLLQEGNIIPEGERLAIAGMPINKSTLADGTKKRLQNILYEDVLTADNIDQVKIIKKLAIMEKDIYNNIINGKKDYYRPDNIKAIAYYDKDPISVNGVKAAMIYNILKDDELPSINLEERNKIIKVKVDFTKKEALEKLKNNHPDKYEKVMTLLNHPVLGKKADVIGFPIDDEIPKWILDFVDFKQIINDNINNFPLDKVGLQVNDNKYMNYSNIVNL